MELTHLSSVSGTHVMSSPAKSDLFILQINIHRGRKTICTVPNKERHIVLDVIYSCQFCQQSFELRVSYSGNIQRYWVVSSALEQIKTQKYLNLTVDDTWAVKTMSWLSDPK